MAAERGRDLGRAERGQLKPGRLGAERALTCAGQLLERHGFEPERATPTLMRLRNCPFHPMAARDPGLVCAINHAFLSGVLDGLGAATLDATLAPRPGACCVELGAAAPTGRAPRWRPPAESARRRRVTAVGAVLENSASVIGGRPPMRSMLSVTP